MAPSKSPTGTTAPTLADHLISTHFNGPRASDERGVLRIGGVPVDALSEAYGTPLFAYDAGLLCTSYQRLSQCLAGFADIFYSIKANPNPHIAKVFVDLGAGIEIASGGEFLKAKEAGCAPENMLFAGPAKGSDELQLSLSQGLGEVHLESFEEIEQVATIAGKLQRTIDVALRINPKAAAQGGAMRMGGKAAAFGFDEENLPEVVTALTRHKGLHLSGVHMFAGTQILDAQVLLTQWAHGLRAASAVAELADCALATIDLGGGLGVPYFDGDTALDLKTLKAGISALKNQQASDARIARARVLVEPGRFLTASAGVYLMQVRVNKTSRGQRFIICDGGMHHHLAASGNLGQVIKRDYPIVAATKIGASMQGEAVVSGPLCTPLDTVGRKTNLPAMAAGDLVAILQSGAYGLTASPVGFLSHPIAKEVLIDGGRHRQI